MDYKALAKQMKREQAQLSCRIDKIAYEHLICMSIDKQQKLSDVVRELVWEAIASHTNLDLEGLKAGFHKPSVRTMPVPSTVLASVSGKNASEPTEPALSPEQESFNALPNDERLAQVLKEWDEA